MTAIDGARRLADAALEATVVGSFSRIGFTARRALFDWDDEPVVDMRGRVAIVTGATGGLGLATAAALAQRKADVWIVGRDPQRIEAARRTVTDLVPNATLTTAVADLAVLDDVRALADRVGRDDTAARRRDPQRRRRSHATCGTPATASNSPRRCTSSRRSC